MSNYRKAFASFVDAVKAGPNGQPADEPTGYRWEWSVEVTYTAESLDSDTPLDINYCETLSEAIGLAKASLDEPDAVQASIVLVATESSPSGPIADRSWATLDDEALPTETSGGLRSLRVPSRFHREVAAASKAAAAAD